MGVVGAVSSPDQVIAATDCFFLLEISTIIKAVGITLAAQPRRGSLSCFCAHACVLPVGIGAGCTSALWQGNVRSMEAEDG